jgi:hypothetical protein
VVGQVLKSCKVAFKGPSFCGGPKVIKPNATRVTDLGSETAFSSETGSERVSGPVSCPSLGLPQSLPEAVASALPNVSSLPESTSELSSGLRLARSFTGGLEDAPSGATVTADPTSSAILGCSLQTEPPSLPSPGVVPYLPSSGTGANIFFFPPVPASDLSCPANPAPSPVSASSCLIPGCADSETPVKKVADSPEPPVKLGHKKGFLNHRPKVPVSPTLPRKANVLGMVGPSSPSRGCQSRNWPVEFDHNGEVVVWEDVNDFWDGLPLDWDMDGDFEEEALAIRDAMEEEFLRKKMIARQKSKGKRELLNLQSSVNYGVASDSYRRRK